MITSNLGSSLIVEMDVDKLAFTVGGRGERGIVGVKRLIVPQFTLVCTNHRDIRKSFCIPSSEGAVCILTMDCADAIKFCRISESVLEIQEEAEFSGETPGVWLGNIETDCRPKDVPTLALTSL